MRASGALLVLAACSVPNKQSPGDLDSLRLGGNYGGALDEVYISQTATITEEAALSRYCPL